MTFRTRLETIHTIPVEKMRQMPIFLPSGSLSLLRMKIGKRRRSKSVPMCMPRTPSWNLILSMHLYSSGVMLASVAKLQRPAIGIHWNAVPNKEIRPHETKIIRMVQ